MRKLRRHDELKGLFEHIQGAIESMRSREVEEAEKLKNALNKLSALASTDDSKALLAELQAMHDRKRIATQPPQAQPAAS